MGVGIVSCTMRFLEAAAKKGRGRTLSFLLSPACVPHGHTPTCTCTCVYTS